MGKLIKEREEIIIPSVRKRNRAKVKPPTHVLSVRVVAEILEYDTQDHLRNLVQKAVNDRLLKHKASGKRKLTKK
jgi:hypothetical protein